MSPCRLRAVAPTAMTVIMLSAVGAIAQPTATPPPAWTASAYGHLEFGTSQETNVSRLRARVNLAPAKGTCAGGRIEVDVVDPRKSYLHQALLACDVKDWRVRTGRLFTAAAMEAPAPHLLKSAKYPAAMPYALYAYGVQADKALGAGWQLMVDFTGRSGLAYDDPRVFERFESSGRVLRRGNAWSYGGAYQASRDFFRGGLDGERRLGRLTASAVVAYTTERAHLEGWVFAEYRLLEWLRPHLQIVRARNRTSTLAGFGANLKEYAYFVVEHDGHGFLARLQLMVSK